MKRLIWIFLFLFVVNIGCTDERGDRLKHFANGACYVDSSTFGREIAKSDSYKMIWNLGGRWKLLRFERLLDNGAVYEDSGKELILEFKLRIIKERGGVEEELGFYTFGYDAGIWEFGEPSIVFYEDKDKIGMRCGVIAAYEDFLILSSFEPLGIYRNEKCDDGGWYYEYVFVREERYEKLVGKNG